VGNIPERELGFFSHKVALVKMKTKILLPTLKLVLIIYGMAAINSQQTLKSPKSAIKK